MPKSDETWYDLHRENFQCNTVHRGKNYSKFKQILLLKHISGIWLSVRDFEHCCLRSLEVDWCNTATSLLTIFLSTALKG